MMAYFCPKCMSDKVEVSIELDQIDYMPMGGRDLFRPAESSVKLSCLNCGLSITSRNDEEFRSMMTQIEMGNQIICVSTSSKIMTYSGEMENKTNKTEEKQINLTFADQGSRILDL